MDNFFEFKYCNNGVIIEKNGTSFSVEKEPDGDIWFNLSNSNIELPISYYSRNQNEFQSYTIFEYLMKSIVGRYLLSGDREDEYSAYLDCANDEIKTTNANGKMISRLLMSESQNEIGRNIIGLL